jgi:ribose/xylose/arabinose/galactoside ABC-type transport system permease subunit
MSLTMSIIPLAILKNGLRIVVITLLGIYVDRGFLTGYLHRRGGIVFFLLSLALLAIVLGMLQRFESRKRKDGGSLSQPSRKSGETDGRPEPALSRQ